MIKKRGSFTNVNITEGIIWRQLLAFFFPILFGTLFQQLYNTADAIIVGRIVGKQALSAVGGTTGILIKLIVNIFIGLSAGTTVLVAQHYGAGRYEEVEDAVHTSMALAVIGGISMTALGLIIAPYVLQAMQTPADIMPYALTYLRVVLWGLVPSFLYNIGAGILRAIGDTRHPNCFLMVGCVSNIILDLVFVAGCGMGVFGAALATIISQTICAFLTILSLVRSQGCYRLVPSKIRFIKNPFTQILAVGIPAGLQSNMYAISNLFTQTCINSFGTDTVAAWTAYGKIDSFFWMVMSAYGISITTFAGQNFGAHRLDRVKESVRAGLLLSAITAVALSVLFCGFNRPLLSIFTSDEAVLAIGRTAVWRVAPFYVTYVCVEIFASAIRGCGNAFTPMLMTAGGICLLRIIWVLVIVPFRHEFGTLLLGYPISYASTSLLFIIYYSRGNWLKRCIAHSEQRSSEEHTSLK